MDVYDKEIEFLANHPERIDEHWNSASPLFSYLVNKEDDIPCDKTKGCLTQVKRANTEGLLRYSSYSKDLNKKIANDNRIPDHEDKITVKSLPVFTEYQHLVDKETGRKTPKDFYVEYDD